MKIKKFLAIILAMTMILTIFAGCGKTPTDPAGQSPNSTGSKGGNENTDTVKIGVILPFTGGSAAVGELQWSGYEYYVNKFNEAGGFSWGAKVELIKADTNTNPETGVTEITRLITEKKVDALLGPYNSSVGSATAPIAEKYEIPYLLTNCTEDSILSNNYRYVFRANTCNSMDAADVINFLEELKEAYPDTWPKTYAIIYENTDWGVGSAEVFAKSIKEIGGTVVLSEPYESDMTDASSLINKVKASNAEVTIPFSYLSDSILITNTLAQYKVDTAILAGGGGFSMPEFVESCGANAEGIMTLSSWHPDILKNKPARATDINEEYKSIYGVDFDEYSSNGYLGAAVLLSAIEKSGGTDKAKVRDALAAMDLGPDAEELILHPYEGIKFSTENEPYLGTMVNQNTKAHNIILQVIDGQFKMVGPMTAAGKDAVVWPVKTWADR